MGRGPPPFPGSPDAAPKPPSAQVLIDFYKKKGLDEQAASVKAIEDLQKALTYSVQRFPKRAQEMEKSIVSMTGHLDTLTKRLATMEAKIDTKPNLAGVFAAGVAAGAVLQATFQGVPHVFRAVTQIGRTVDGPTSSP